MHNFGGQVAANGCDQAREQVAGLLGASPEEIVFTSCGTESGQHRPQAAPWQSQPGKRHIVTTRVEHPAVLNYLPEPGHPGL